MSLRQEITNKIREIANTQFSERAVKYVPNINNRSLTLGNTGLRFPAAVLYIDVRQSTKKLDMHQKKVIAKLHMAYYHAITNIAVTSGGRIRSFNGDSMLVFFPGTPKESIHNAIEAAMQMTFIINHANTVLEKKYSTIDFGIGVDYGDILCTKIGIEKTYNTMDLIWIGHAVNKATKLSDKAKRPYHIYVSKDIYSTLDHEYRYEEKSFLGLLKWDSSKWEEDYFRFNGESETCYYTASSIEVD